MKSHKNEYVKTKSLYDIQGRVEYIYQADVDIKDGGPCVCTQYSYVGATSVVDYSKEYEAVWLAAWETF